MTFTYYNALPISTEGQEVFRKPGAKSQLYGGDVGGGEIISS